MAVSSAAPRAVSKALQAYAALATSADRGAVRDLEQILYRGAEQDLLRLSTVLEGGLLVSYKAVYGYFL